MEALPTAESKSCSPTPQNVSAAEARPDSNSDLTKWDAAELPVVPVMEQNLEQNLEQPCHTSAGRQTGPSSLISLYLWLSVCFVVCRQFSCVCCWIQIVCLSTFPCHSFCRFPLGKPTHFSWRPEEVGGRRSARGSTFRPADSGADVFQHLGWVPLKQTSDTERNRERRRIQIRINLLWAPHPFSFCIYRSRANSWRGSSDRRPGRGRSQEDVGDESRLPSAKGSPGSGTAAAHAAVAGCHHL